MDSKQRIILPFELGGFAVSAPRF